MCLIKGFVQTESLSIPGQTWQINPERQVDPQHPHPELVNGPHYSLCRHLLFLIHVAELKPS